MTTREHSGDARPEPGYFARSALLFERWASSESRGSLSSTPLLTKPRPSAPIWEFCGPFSTNVTRSPTQWLNVRRLGRE